MSRPCLLINRDLLAYHTRLEWRDPRAVELVVVHATELPDLAEARRYGGRIVHEATRTGNSGHYYIDRDGAIHQYVEDQRVAHHVKGHNQRSIGIELVNLGRYPDWLDSRRQEPSDPFPPAQIDALAALIAELARRLPGLKLVAGHADLDRTLVEASDDPSLKVRRKIDPGPQFPWPELLARISLERTLD